MFHLFILLFKSISSYLHFQILNKYFSFCMIIFLQGIDMVNSYDRPKNHSYLCDCIYAKIFRWIVNANKVEGAESNQDL